MFSVCEREKLVQVLFGGRLRTVMNFHYIIIIFLEY